jgi:hypothetical protein
MRVALLASPARTLSLFDERVSERQRSGTQRLGTDLVQPAVEDREESRFLLLAEGHARACIRRDCDRFFDRSSRLGSAQALTELPGIGVAELDHLALRSDSEHQRPVNAMGDGKCFGKSLGRLRWP